MWALSCHVRVTNVVSSTHRAHLAAVAVAAGGAAPLAGLR